MRFKNVAVTSLLAVIAVESALAQSPPGGASTPAKKTPVATAPAKPAPVPAKSAPASRPPARPAPSSDRLDGIAAVVNDEVVLQSDVEDQLFQFLAQTKAQPDPATVDTMRRQVLEQLINEKLIVAEAKRSGVTASEAEINRQIDEALRQKKEALGGEQAFQEQLRAENTTEALVRQRYRQQLQRDLLARRMVEKALPRRTIGTAEAETYFKAHPEQFPKKSAEARLQVIQIPALPDSATDAKGRAAALAARSRIMGGEKFAKVAAEVSEDPGSARSGGDLGFFTRGSLEPGIEGAAFSLRPGVVSEPIRTQFGWHLLEVIERDTVKTRAGRDSLDEKGYTVLETHARHILIRVPVGDDDTERARTLAVRVRGEAAKGTDFGTLARRYSKYVGPHDGDGDIGFVPLATLQPAIRAGLDSLEVGQISEVLQNAIGFNIFRVVERRPERPYTYEEIKTELPDAVAEIKLRERYEEWVKGLRAKAHVEVRSS